jgi:tellurite resistance protein
MDIQIFHVNELQPVLRTLRAVAVANDAFTEAERDFVQTIAQIHGASVDVDALEPIELEELASVLVDPHRRKRAVQLAIVMALVEGTPDERTERTVRALASTLGIAESGVEVLYDISHGHTLLARVAMMRRMRDTVRQNHGFPGFLATALQALGFAGEDSDLAGRYEALGALPTGSFGRAIHTHFRQNHFPFPGEKRGFSAIMFHDLGHVLSGYDTNPEGEIQQAAFQAGFKRQDGFFFLLFGVLQFHVGVRVTPIAQPQRGLFDVKRVLRAVERGAACNVDLGAGFDLFAYADMPLDRVRAELGIPSV